VVLPDYPEVPPDNNRAERDLRLAGTKRAGERGPALRLGLSKRQTC